MPQGRPVAYARPVLRITDSRTGQLVDATGRGLTRVRPHVGGTVATDLRVLLTADLLARLLEIGGTTVWGVTDTAGIGEELRRCAEALGVRPFESDGRTGPLAGQVVHVVAGGGDRVPQDGVRMEVAPVDATAVESAGRLLRDSDDTDGTALRLALTAVPRTQPLRLTPDFLANAREKLVGWRHAVAVWANSPSRPVPGAVRQDLVAAWEDDLDVPAVLGVLERVSTDPEVPDGARFETYAYADRLLGLELTREIGSVL